MSTEKLLAIKDQIDKAKNKKSEIKGQISAIENQMKTNFKVDNLSDAEKKLKTMGNELDKKEKEFEIGMEKLENAYDWEE